MVEIAVAVHDLQDEAVGQLEILAAAGDAEGDVLQRALLARAVRVEERELAPARVEADQREPVGALDDVHAERPSSASAMASRSVTQSATWSSVGESPRHLSQSDSPYASADFLRLTARWSCALFIFERPLMPRRLASL